MKRRYSTVVERRVTGNDPVPPGDFSCGGSNQDVPWHLYVTSSRARISRHWPRTVWWHSRRLLLRTEAPILKVDTPGVFSAEEELEEAKDDWTKDTPGDFSCGGAEGD